MTVPLVKFLETDRNVIAAETTLTARAEDVYALVANPARHAELDGGGTIQNLSKGEDAEFKEGDTFSQKMVLGITYTLPMTVTRAEKNRAVTWLHPGKHTWAWDIFDNNDGTVTVRETFDARNSVIAGIPLYKLYHLLGSFSANRKNIALSLAKLHRIFS